MRRRSWRDSASAAGTGCERIFSCCEGFAPGTDLLEWMNAHSDSGRQYVNWRGRTVRRVSEEAALSTALERYVEQHRQRWPELSPREVHARLRDFVDAQTCAGRPHLVPRGADAAGLVDVERGASDRNVPLVAGAAASADRRCAPSSRTCCAALEKTDPEMCFRVDQRHSDALALLEDHDVTNQFSAMGSEAGAGAALDGDARAPDHRLRRAALLHSRPARARAHHPLRALGVARRRASAWHSSATTTAASRATWTTSSTRSASVSTSCSATASAIRSTNWLVLRRVQGRAQVQGIPAPPPAAHAGLVQRVSGSDAPWTWSATRASARGSSRRR